MEYTYSEHEHADEVEAVEQCSTCGCGVYSCIHCGTLYCPAQSERCPDRWKAKAKRYESVVFHYSQPDGVLHREDFTPEEQVEVETLERELGEAVCKLVQQFASWDDIEAARNVR